MLFNINDFHKNAITKFYYEKGRHAATSLRDYRGKLYVHKLLGSKYRGVNDFEYKKLIGAMASLESFLKKNTELLFPKVSYIGYSKEYNCIERIEEYSGITLSYAYPTANSEQKQSIISQLLRHLSSITQKNGGQVSLEYSIDPTPDNFTFDGDCIYYIDFMPPLVKNGDINPQFISDKSRTEDDLSIQTFRYFTQKGLYLTFLTKFGAADVSSFDYLFKQTLKSITNDEVSNYIYNVDIKKIENLLKDHLSYYLLQNEIYSLFKNYTNLDRDMLRLIGLYFVKDYPKIASNALRYRVSEVEEYLVDKRCAADIVKGLIYSELRGINKNEELKKTVADLIALQYSK